MCTFRVVAAAAAAAATATATATTAAATSVAADADGAAHPPPAAEPPPAKRARPARAPRPPRLYARLAHAPEENEVGGSATERVWELADASRTARFAAAVRVALLSLPPGAVCVDVGEGALCACLAAGMAQVG